MKNLVIAIREAEARSRFYVIIESDIETGKAYAYNPEKGYTVITAYKDRDVFATDYIRKNPFDWMVSFDSSKVKIPENWMK